MTRVGIVSTTICLTGKCSPAKRKPREEKSAWWIDSIKRALISQRSPGMRLETFQRFVTLRFYEIQGARNQTRMIYETRSVERSTNGAKKVTFAARRLERFQRRARNLFSPHSAPIWALPEGPWVGPKVAKSALERKSTRNACR